MIHENSKNWLGPLCSSILSPKFLMRAQPKDHSHGVSSYYLALLQNCFLNHLEYMNIFSCMVQIVDGRLIFVEPAIAKRPAEDGNA